MAWFGKQSGARGRMAAVGLLLGCLSVTAAERGDVDYWFNRHPETLWRPLAERWDAVKAAMTTPVENLVLPLDYHPNGRVKAQLRARKAQLFLDGIIFGEDVSVDMLTEDGKLDGRMTAEGCIFDRKAKHGYCRGKVTLVKGIDRLKGRDMYFSFDEQFIKILNECEIRTTRVQNNFGRLK